MDEEKTTEDASFGTGLHVIIVTYDESTGYPAVELGDVSPYLAASIFRSAVDALEYLIPTPKIQYGDRVLLDPMSQIEEYTGILEDDEDDD